MTDEIITLKILLKLMHDNYEESNFEHGMAEYEKGDYFQAHDIWEELWSDYSRKDRLFIQGLIQLSVSFVHLQNGNLTGARNLLSKCRQKFDNYSGNQRGINMENLKKSLEILSIVYKKLKNPQEFDWDLVPIL